MTKSTLFKRITSDAAICLYTAGVERGGGGGDKISAKAGAKWVSPLDSD